MAEVRFVDTTDSTQLDVRRALAENPELPWGWTVQALEQTAGRGRLGRQWASHGLDSLMWSTWLPLQIAPDEAPLLTLAAGLAIADILTAAVRLKWPNDVLSPDGRKLAGILTEAVFDGAILHGAIVGVGLNVSWGPHGPPAELVGRAVSLRELDIEVGRGADEVIAPWLDALGRRLDDLQRHRDRFVADYNAHLLDRTRRVCLEGVDGGPVVGYIEGIDASGGVWLRRSDGGGRLRTTIGELSLIDRPLT